MPKPKPPVEDEQEEIVIPLATSPEEYRKTTLPMRRKLYRQTILGMTVDPALYAWAERMTAKQGKTVKVWHNELPWVEALMVVRYGEDVSSWPRATSVADHGRAMAWESGEKVPDAVVQASKLSLG